MGLLCSGAPAVSQAAGAPSVGLRYRAVEGCPGREAFAAGLRRRAPGVKIVEAGQGVVQYEVSFEQAGDEIVGRLRIRGAQGERWEREVTSGSCADAATALSFIAGFSLAAAPEPPPPPEAPPPPPDASEEAASRPSWSAGLDGVGTTATAPRVAWGAEIHAEVQFPGAIGPSLRLAAGGVTSGGVDSPPGSASFRLLRARLEACPVSGELGAVWLAPCAGYELGALRAAGGGVDEPRAESRFWGALRLGGRARWPARGTWFAEVEGALVAPLTSRSFVFDNPRVEVFSTPRLGTTAGLGIGWRFP
jgi:hypothetical protein